MLFRSADSDSAPTIGSTRLIKCERFFESTVNMGSLQISDRLDGAEFLTRRLNRRLTVLTTENISPQFSRLGELTLYKNIA